MASQLYEALVPFRARHAIDGIGGYDMGSVERPLGMLASLRGDDSLAAVHFDAALRKHRHIGARLLVAGTLRDAGRYLGDAAMLAEAEADYAALGLHQAADATEARPCFPDSAGGRNVFRREGDVWLVGLSGTHGRVRDTKGMGDLARLLAQPGTEVHALDLVADGPTLLSGPAGDAPDAEARRRYRARLVEIEDDLAEADQRCRRRPLRTPTRRARRADRRTLGRLRAGRTGPPAR